MLVGIADPKARLRREPIETAQPERRGFEPRVIEDFRFAIAVVGCPSQLPVVTIPLPRALIQLADGKKPKLNRFVAQFENELRCRGVCDAKLLPFLVL